MPCRLWSSRPCSARGIRAAETTASPATDLPTPTSAPDVESWKDIRKYNLRMMRKQVRYIVLVMALLETLRIGPMELAYAGKHGYPSAGPNDFGLVYSVACFLSWLYVCLFMVVWMPLFNWWVPKVFPNFGASEDPSKPTRAMAFMCALKKLDMFLLPVAIGISFAMYIFWVAHTFIYVDSRPYGSNKLPKNNRKNWAVRAIMAFGIAITTFLGHGALRILDHADLAHVKPLEYRLIIIPVLVNFGIFLGSIKQFRMEKKLARRQALMMQAVRVPELEAVSEKAALLEV